MAMWPATTAILPDEVFTAPPIPKAIACKSSKEMMVGGVKLGGRGGGYGGWELSILKNRCAVVVEMCGLSPKVC